MDKPLVSLIMPTYNRGSLIAESIEAIINQTYKNWECIIVDDGSIDDSHNVINSYCETDKRIKFFDRPKERPKGANSCRNYGLEMSLGEFILWVDSDDIIHPKCLEFCLNQIYANSVDFCRFSKTVFFDSNHDYSFSDPIVSTRIPLNEMNIIDLLNYTIPFNTCTVLWSKSAIGKEQFSEIIFYGDEWEFYSRLLSNGLKGISIDTILYYVRKHENSTTAEFWSNNKVRRDSKVKASELIIENLNAKSLLNYRLSLYFINLSLFLKDKRVYKMLMKNAGHLSISQKTKLQMRYHFNFLIKPIYKTKRAFIKNIFRNDDY